MRKRKLDWIDKTIIALFVILGAFVFYQVAIPKILGFNLAQAHRWGAFDESAEILREWSGERNHAGSVTIQSGGGQVTVEMRDGEITRTIITGKPGEAAIADAARIARGEEWSGET